MQRVGPDTRKRRPTKTARVRNGELRAKCVRGSESNWANGEIQLTLMVPKESLEVALVK